MQCACHAPKRAHDRVRNAHSVNQAPSSPTTCGRNPPRVAVADPRALAPGCCEHLHTPAARTSRTRSRRANAERASHSPRSQPLAAALTGRVGTRWSRCRGRGVHVAGRIAWWCSVGGVRRLRRCNPGCRWFVRREYRLRRDALHKHLPRTCRWDVPSHSIVLWLRLPEGLDSYQVYEDALAAGVLVSPSPVGGRRHRNARASAAVDVLRRKSRAFG